MEVALPSDDALDAIRNDTPFVQRTNWVENALLALTIFILPFQPLIPSIRGISAGFLTFLCLAAWCAAFRPRILGSVFRQPIFIVGFLFVLVAFAVETIHGDPAYHVVARIFMMMTGGVLIATVCRDRQSMGVAMASFLLAGVALSIVMIFTSYGALDAGTASGFKESSQLRTETLGDNPLEADLNAISFMIGQGVVVAVGLGLAAKSRTLRFAVLPLGLLCLVGCLLPMSRGGFVIVAVSCATIACVYGVVRFQTLILGAALVAAAYLLVPEAVFARVNPFAERSTAEEKGDRRPVLMRAVIENLPDYIVTGVGVRNYFGRWGRTTDFFKRGTVSGSHNIFSQVTLYWGAAALLLVVALVGLSVFAIPWRAPPPDPLRLCLLGIALSVFLHALLVHTVEGKEFSLVLGLIVAARMWIWPPARRFETQQVPV